jgi:hypothetical protein
MTVLKGILFLTIMAAFAGCSSAKKNDMPAAAPAPTTTATTPTTTTETKMVKPEDKKKMTRPEKVATADPNAKEIKCTAGSEERILAIAAKGEGCELNYTKAGETKAIATQILGDGRCVEVMSSIRAKLEDAQFSCQ